MVKVLRYCLSLNSAYYKATWKHIYNNLFKNDFTMTNLHVEYDEASY